MVVDAKKRESVKEAEERGDEGWQFGKQMLFRSFAAKFHRVKYRWIKRRMNAKYGFSNEKCRSRVKEA